MWVEMIVDENEFMEIIRWNEDIEEGDIRVERNVERNV